MGKISLTCDAWQASNTDGYFAVTGHWIEEQSSGQWKLEHAILGFTRMNTVHNGKRLGQALFKICLHLEIVHKVCELTFPVVFLPTPCHSQIGHVTCDNASNNGTMMYEFGRCYENKTGESFDVRKRHIR
jgi:hypothetical protein